MRFFFFCVCAFFCCCVCVCVSVFFPPNGTTANDATANDASDKMDSIRVCAVFNREDGTFFFFVCLFRALFLCFFFTHVAAANGASDKIDSIRVCVCGRFQPQNSLEKSVNGLIVSHYNNWRRSCFFLSRGFTFSSSGATVNAASDNLGLCVRLRPQKTALRNQ